MSSILYPPTRPQSIAEVIDTAFRIFKATLIRCLPFSVLATVVGQLQNVYVIVTRQKLHQFNNTDPIWWTLYVLGVFLGITFINAIIIRQGAMASGAPSAGSAAFMAGLRSVPATFAMYVLIGAIVGLCFVPLMAVPHDYWLYSLIALGIPASFIGVSFLCAWPAMLIGHKGIAGSLRYSVSLIRGNWWRTVAVYTVALIMIIVLSVTAGMIVGVLAALGASRDIAVTTAISAVMVVASGAIYMPFVTAMTLALYGDLQARREGTDLERRIAGEQAG
jgi:hypothetical protein